MKRILLVILLISVPLTARAQRFPYQSDVFFQECPHLRDARHNEPNDAYIIDLGCARYIEGFETGYIKGAGVARSCLADPLTIYNAAEELYRKDQYKDFVLDKYLAAAVKTVCKIGN